MSERFKIDKSRLFSQRGLVDIIKLYHACFPWPLPAVWQGALTFCIMFPFLLLSGLLEVSKGVHIFGENELISLIVKLADGGFALGVGMLSVAIAGFAIFASGLDQDALRRLIKRDKPQVEKPYLLFVFSFFVYALVVLLFLCATSLFLEAVFSRNLPADAIMDFIFGESQFFLLVLVASLQSAQLVFTFSILKSFIWNLYETLLSISAMKAEGPVSQEGTSHQQHGPTPETMQKKTPKA
jgi:uncharacterized membrane protein YqhA